MNLPKTSFVLSLLLTGFLSRADEITKVAKVEEFMRVANLETTFKGAMTQMALQAQSGIAQQIVGAQGTPQQIKASEEFQTKVFALISQALSWDQLKPAFVKLYADVFTEEELDGIIAFYKSPVGQAMVSKTPILMSRSMEFAQQRMMSIQPQLQKLMEETKAQGQAQTP